MEELLAPLQRFIDPAGRVLVMHDEAAAPLVARLTGDLVRASVGDGLTDHGGRWGGVLVVVADRAALRRAVSALPNLGKSRAFGIGLLESDLPLLATVRPEWPPLSSVHARVLGDSAWTVLRFARPPRVRPVLLSTARGSSVGGTIGNRGLFVSVARDWPHPALPADSSTLSVEVAAQAADPDLSVPPDVVLTTRSETLEEHEVIARRPVTVSPAGIGPIDESILNPTGFLQYGDNGQVASLESDAQGAVLLRGPGLDLPLGRGRGATARAVERLRSFRGCEVRWQGPDDELAATAAGFAMAGIPLTSAGDTVPPDVLSSRLRSLVTDPVDLADPLRREEHSVRLRRLALSEHSVLACRGGLAGVAGLDWRPFPSCSVVLATRREHQVEFAVEQFTRQRGLDAELVLATHGFTPDPGHIRDLAAGRRVTVVPMPADALFGEVLNAGVAAAAGDLVVKMDDDDWYGPDFLTDLLWARHYSGADVIGMTAEYVYLEAIDVTVRRTDDSERTAQFVAGGTMMMDRAMLNGLGGFRRVRRYVDASLLASVHAAGGTVYRTHGLGYVLRRSASGHTWDPGLDYFLDAERLGSKWDGFTPSLLLEADPAHTPSPASGSR